jgi:hypothetical protein
MATKVQIRSTLGGTNTNTCRDTWWLVAYQTTFALRHLKYSLHLGDIPPGEKHDDVGNTRGARGATTGLTRKWRVFVFTCESICSVCRFCAEEPGVTRMWLLDRFFLGR